MRLQNNLEQEFVEKSKGINATIFHNIGCECINLSTKRSIPSIRCEHHEADTKMFFYASVLSSPNPVPACVLDAEDKDVYVIASKVSQEILAPLLIHRKGKYYDGSQLCPHEIRQYTTQIYVISSYDTVSGFYDHGKKTIVKKAIASTIVCSKLRQLGQEVPFNENNFSEIEEFVLHAQTWPQPSLGIK